MGLTQDRYVYLVCFAPNCKRAAALGKYCREHVDFDRILREQVVILEEIGADAEIVAHAKSVCRARAGE